jgi:hypothetical protein
VENTVYCLASSEAQANSILTHLRNLSFSPSEISVVLPAHLSDTKNISMKEDAIRGAETGGVVGGILGWLAGISALALPGVGAFIAAGPLVSALGGAVAGGVVGGLAGGSGAVHPLGLPKDISARIEDRLRAGDILISVHSDDPVVRERAVRVFRASGADDIYYHDEEAAA